MSVSQAAKDFYESKLRSLLEQSHHGEYVAIEPETGSHFLGKTFLDAAMAAKNSMPNHRSFVMRIGHDAAVHIGFNSI